MNKKKIYISYFNISKFFQYIEKFTFMYPKFLLLVHNQIMETKDRFLVT